jgi:hypothetical protein
MYNSSISSISGFKKLSYLCGRLFTGTKEYIEAFSHIALSALVKHAGEMVSDAIELRLEGLLGFQPSSVR